MAASDRPGLEALDVRVVRGNDWRPLLDLPRTQDEIEIVGDVREEDLRARLSDAARLSGRVVAVVVPREAEPGPATAAAGSGWRAATAVRGSGMLAVARPLAEAARRPSSAGLVPGSTAELAHRLSMLGAAFVPVPADIAPPDAGSDPVGAARAGHRLPGWRERVRVSGRHWQVPAVVAEVVADGCPGADLLAALDALLSQTVEDLVVAVDPGEHDALVRATYDGHPRVRLGEAGAAALADADVPWTLRWPVSAAPTPRTVEHLIAIAQRRVAALVPLHVAGTEAVPLLARRAALSRLVAPGEALPEPVAAAAETTGAVWWVDGASVGTGARGSSVHHATVLWERVDTPSSAAVRRAEGAAREAAQRAAVAEAETAALRERLSQRTWRARIGRRVGREG